MYLKETEYNDNSLTQNTVSFQTSVPLTKQQSDLS